ncbi:flagellar basal body P-ring formation chaperone FlgA [Thermocrinis sp.]
MWKVLSLLLPISFCFSLSEAELKAKVEEQIKRKFGDDVRVAKIELLSWDKKGEGEPNIELEMEYGKARAMAHVEFGDRRLTAVVVPLWRARLLSAKYDIQRGSQLYPELFTIEERWLRSIPNDLRISLEEVKNYQASTYIPKGSILRRSVIKPLPAVERSDVVKLVLRSGALEVSTQGVSLDRGEVGKVVRVKTQSGKVLRCRVIERGVVEVVE